MNTKICSKCRQVKLISDFSRKKDTKDGYRWWCKDCERECMRAYTKAGYFREYQRRPEVKSRINKNKANYRARPDIRIKNLARWYTNHEIRAGRINREPCAMCGKEQSEAHHLDYNQPLIIVWLCPDCHRSIHIKEELKR